jgi:DNA modification methylase
MSRYPARRPTGGPLDMLALAQRVAATTTIVPLVDDIEVVDAELVLDARGRHRSPANRPGAHRGVAPANKGLRYPPDPPTVTECMAMLRACPPTPYGRRLYAAIMLMWQGALRAFEALAVTEADLDDESGRIQIRHGKGDKQAMIRMAQWAWPFLDEWRAMRRELPNPRGPLLCVIDAPTAGRAWSYPDMRRRLKDVAARPGSPSASRRTSCATASPCRPTRPACRCGPSSCTCATRTSGSPTPTCRASAPTSRSSRSTSRRCRPSRPPRCSSSLEDTPDEYVAALVETFREVRRVLADDGTVWLNLGDSYNARQRGNDNGWDKSRLTNPARVQKAQSAALRPRPAFPGSKPKDLLGIPWMVAFALRDDGWYLRSEIIWSKPSCMPESVGDRPTRAHEQIFLLSKQRYYFYDADAIREEPAEATLTDRRVSRSRSYEGDPRGGNQSHAGASNGHPVPTPEAGRNKRSVWTVASQPFPGAHFATFPPKLIEPCILAGSRAGDVVLDPFAGQRDDRHRRAAA